MSQRGNYTSIWSVEHKIKLLKYDMYFLCFTCFTLFVGLILLLTDNQNQENRLNEHKRLLIAQQEQINKLILNAEYNEKKVR